MEFKATGRQMLAIAIAMVLLLAIAAFAAYAWKYDEDITERQYALEAKRFVELSPEKRQQESLHNARVLVANKYFRSLEVEWALTQPKGYRLKPNPAVLRESGAVCVRYGEHSKDYYKELGRFIATPDLQTVSAKAENARDFDALWARFCGGKSENDIDVTNDVWSNMHLLYRVYWDRRTE